MKHTGRKLLVAAAIAAIAGGSYAFLDSNQVNTSYAGSGAGMIAGYKVTSTTYQTAPADSLPIHLLYTVQSVTFTLNHPASLSNVSALIERADDGTTVKYGSCTGSGQTFTCAATSTPLKLHALSTTPLILGVTAAS